MDAGRRNDAPAPTTRRRRREGTGHNYRRRGCYCLRNRNVLDLYRRRRAGTGHNYCKRGCCSFLRTCNLPCCCPRTCNFPCCSVLRTRNLPYCCLCNCNTPVACHRWLYPACRRGPRPGEIAARPARIAPASSGAGETRPPRTTFRPRSQPEPQLPRSTSRGLRQTV